MAARLEIPRTRWTRKQAAWRGLEDHRRAMRGRYLQTFFADDLARSERMTAEAAGVFPDYSKNRIDGETPPSRRQNVMPRVHAAGAPVSALSWRMRRSIISAIAP